LTVFDAMPRIILWLLQTHPLSKPQRTDGRGNDGQARL
jgi:hypothetical protein